MKIQLKRSNVLVENNARQPTAGQMEYGELAVNYNTTDPAIFIKDSNNNIIRIAGKYNIADDGQVELPATPTPPSDPKAGNLWYNNTDGRLYIYYTDEDTSQWVDASPDSWDPSSYPDVTDDTAQSGTLDDRYLMLNSANDPVTGGLNITGGNVGIGTTNPATTLDVDGSIYFSSRLRSTNGGTAANPSIQPGNDADTGIFHPTEANTIGFATTGAERMRINSNGKVGIGTNSPVAKLEAVVDSTGKAEVARFRIQGQTNNPMLRCMADEANKVLSLETSGSTGATQLAFATSSNEAMRINSNGNVGIGTDNPSSILEVKNEGAGEQTVARFKSENSEDSAFLDIRANPDANEVIYKGTGSSPSDHVFLTGNTERFRIDSSGNVGIGTDSPDSILDIQGSGQDALSLATTGSACKLNLADSGTTGDIYFQTLGNDLRAVVNGGERMRIDNDGNVGIGTNDPAVLLDLKSNDPRINLTDTDAGGIFQIRNTSGAGYVTMTGASPIVFSTNSSEKLRILSGGGITFNGDTSSLNALDDYEEGTFVPTFISTGTNPSVVYGTREGYYTKIGNVVYFTFTMTVTTVNSVGTGNLQVTGFPVDALNNNNQRAGGFVGYAVNWVEAQGAPASWLFC